LAKSRKNMPAENGTKMLRFALCADDYALTLGVSRGILDLLQAQRLTAVSVMTTQAGWPTAAGELKPFISAVDVGLHLNLTLGAPLGAMPGLAPAGEFPAVGALVRTAVLGRLPLGEIGAEIERSHSISGACRAIWTVISMSTPCRESGTCCCGPSPGRACAGVCGSAIRATGSMRSWRGR
jgi:YdjC-like protein